MANQTSSTARDDATAASLADMPVGRQIRDLRKAKGMTLTVMAARIGRSVGFVSQVERELSKPTVTDLSVIARALGVPPSWFFQGNAMAPVEEREHVVRAQNRRRLHFAESGLTEELLSPDLRGTTELLVSTFEPHASSGEALIRRDAEEAGLVLSGQFDLWVETHCFHLNAGDSFRVHRHEGLRWANPSDEETQVVWVLSPPVF